MSPTSSAQPRIHANLLHPQKFTTLRIDPEAGVRRAIEESLHACTAKPRAFHAASRSVRAHTARRSSALSCSTVSHHTGDALPRYLQTAMHMLLERNVDAHVVHGRSTGIGIDLLNELLMDDRYFVAGDFGPLAMRDLLLEGGTETRQRMQQGSADCLGELCRHSPELLTRLSQLGFVGAMSVLHKRLCPDSAQFTMPDGAPAVFAQTGIADAMFVVSRWEVDGLALQYTGASRVAIQTDHNPEHALDGTRTLIINFLIARSGHVVVDWDASYGLVL